MIRAILKHDAAGGTAYQEAKENRAMRKEEILQRYEAEIAQCEAEAAMRAARRREFDETLTMMKEDKPDKSRILTDKILTHRILTDGLMQEEQLTMESLQPVRTIVAIPPELFVSDSED